MNRDIVLFPTHEQAQAYRMALCQTDARAAFSLRATTPSAWLAETWSLYGDGRRIISRFERLCAIRSLLQQQADAAELFQSEGFALFLARLFSEGFGVRAFEQALMAPPEVLSEGEQKALLLALPYRKLLYDHGRIEPGDALANLSEMALQPTFTLGAQFDLSPAFASFCEQTGALKSTQTTPDEVRITALPSGVELCFLFAAGPSAHDALIADYLRETLELSNPEKLARRALVASADPLGLHEALARAFKNDPVACNVLAAKPFFETDFGRAYKALFDFLSDETPDITALVDFFFSPYSGLSSARASELESALVADRLTSFEEGCALAHLVSPNFDAFEELILDSDASLLLDYFSDLASSLPSFDAAWHAEQKAAISVLRAAYEDARAWSVQPADFVRFLQDLTVPVSRCAGAGEASIMIVDAHSALIGADAFDVVLISDLDARYVSAGEDHASAASLLRKLGAGKQNLELNRARRRFEAFKALAKHHFACERVLSAGGEEDIYPAFTLDEFLECYRAPEEMPNELGVPAQLATCVQVRGEEHFEANSTLIAADANRDHLSLQSVHCEQIPSPQRADLLVAKTSNRLSEAHSQPAQTENASQPLVLSPSAIEAYINCPKRWFYTQRLRPHAPDEGFGPLEQGVFAHSVFQTFYSQWPRKGYGKRVTPASLLPAQTFLSEVFDATLATQPEQPGTRYVPITPSEQASCEHLKVILLDNLSLQAQMLPGFEPWGHEVAFTADDAIEVAGVRLHGRVDRIDVNHDLRCYTVIDYKGSIIGHEAGCASCDAFTLPHKVQGLLYALALRGRVSSYRPVGALYLNYRARDMRGLCSGSANGALFELLETAGKKSHVEFNFDTYLEMVESAIAQRLNGLREGIIEANPLCADSCWYCPALECPRRLA